MKKYNVKVNGTTYEVEVEEVNGEISNIQAPAAAAQMPQASAPQAPKPQVKKVITDGEKIECPMPGTVLKVNINAGDTVKKGQVMFILEAMKMENEIMAPHDANIVEVNVTKGAAVNTGDVLAVIS
ncbi:biotin/lipoyl-binding protein [Clostridium sp. CS001]|uniref:biotin/lipoyl-containing protein n=1 Tax=Clostridium sp. CS001 TaxID=2880648 RepID=UPI001CF4EB00|nr:biotin/lipoyl-containing protein [Clostridium sp. CS001]MCB2291001.1 biotin/lipoyl-binding protein [Clostridium sp. CS001]